MKGGILFTCLFALACCCAVSSGQFLPYRPYGYGAVRSYYYSGAAPYAAAPYAAAPYAAAPYAAASLAAAPVVLSDYYGLAASAALSYPGYGGYAYPYAGAYGAGYPYLKK